MTVKPRYSQLNEESLTHATLTDLLDYNPKTGEFRWRVYRNSQAMCGDSAGNDTGKSIDIKIRGRVFRAHRLARFYILGEWPDKDIDHKNGNYKDNSWENLRECSHSQNMHNTKKRSDNTSGYKGVCQRGGKFLAYITHEGARHWLGSFHTALEAAQRVDQFRSLLHKEFARNE